MLKELFDIVGHCPFLWELDEKNDGSLMSVWYIFSYSKHAVSFA